MIRDPVARTAAAYLVLLCVVAVLAPALVPHDPRSGVLADALQGPSTDHWLGTDNLGRDVLSRLAFGARTALLAGIEVVLIAVLIGLPIGLLAGYHGGWFDRIVMRVVEIAASLPALVVAIAVVAATGPGVATSMLAVGLVAATIMARLTRAVVLAASAEDYVEGARTSGASDIRIIVRHMLPNVTPSLIVQVTWLFAAAVLAEASLSFLGLGAVPPDPSWGVMLSQASAQFEEAPLMAVWPGLCIFLTVLAFNQLGDRTRDTLGRGHVAALDEHRIESVVRVRRGDATWTSTSPNALELRRVSVTYPGQRPAEVVSDVTFSIAAGEVLGLVGESGAGKSTTALAALALVPPPAITTAASITVDGVELVGLRPGGLQHVRGRRIGFVAQDPFTALNPVYTVGHQIAEPLRWHLGRSRREARSEAAEWLARVGIPPARLDDHPHEFSGGELQRIALAMALACRPAVLVADEPTTALDTVTQAQMLDLILDLRDSLGLAVLLISHDLGVVAGIADRVAVMRSGRIVETQDVAGLLTQPRDPYTRALLDAALFVDRHGARSSGGSPVASELEIG